jgi:hypothetical protein
VLAETPRTSNPKAKPEHNEVTRDLQVLRLRGLLRLRSLDLPALSRLADLAGTPGPGGVERLLREAVQKLGNDEIGLAAAYLFGLVQGTIGRRPTDLRERAAIEYGHMSPETFRKGPERLLIARLADELLEGGSDYLRNRVFVIHGRDLQLQDRFFHLLRDMGLHPLLWEDLVTAAGDAGPAPYIGEVVARAPLLAQACVVLLSPDERVQLHPDLVGPHDPVHESALSMQASPNVIYELGQAQMAFPERMLVVEAGMVRPIGDLFGINVVRFDGGSRSVSKLASRLRLAGCELDERGAQRWIEANGFADLPLFERTTWR